jgi:hypothetical protein
MDKVHNSSISEGPTVSSEPFRFQMQFVMCEYEGICSRHLRASQNQMQSGTIRPCCVNFPCLFVVLELHLTRYLKFYLHNCQCSHLSVYIAAKTCHIYGNICS